MTSSFSQIEKFVNEKAETCSTVEFFSGATSLGKTTAGSNDDGSFFPGSALFAESYSITAQATDANDNTSSTSISLSMS